jgi:serine/threonine-protein kinase
MTINPDRWRVLSPYLDEALEIAVEERAAWLARIAARDSSLAADLRKMLVRHRLVHESHFLERALLEPGATPTRSRESKLQDS